MTKRSLKFWKIAATGNDFILMDNRDRILTGEEAEIIKRICTRRKSVGADGVIFIEDSEKADYKIRYFNSDGYESTMCGNAGRASIFFTYYRGIAGRIQSIEVFDGIHSGTVYKNEIEFEIIVKGDPQEINIQTTGKKQIFGYKIDTGVPHFVSFDNNIDDLDIVKIGKEIRYHEKFRPEGVNVNFIEITDDLLKVRVYERGVEDETLSCGTGATACAVVANSVKQIDYPISLSFPGGTLRIDRRDDRFFIIGEVNLIFKGKLFL